jgi:hypothetical protein
LGVVPPNVWPSIYIFIFWGVGKITPKDLSTTNKYGCWTLTGSFSSKWMANFGSQPSICILILIFFDFLGVGSQTTPHA